MLKNKQYLTTLIISLTLILTLGACAQTPESGISANKTVSLPGETPSTDVQPIYPLQETQITPTPSSSLTAITITDALGRTVNFGQAPQKIMLVGKAVIMVADAAYMFPSAKEEIVAIAEMNQSANNFIEMVDPNFNQKGTLSKTAGPEQIAAFQPDCVIMKTSNAEKLGVPLGTLKIPVIYLDLETPEQYQRDVAILGEVFQQPERAKEINQYYQAAAGKITEAVASLGSSEKPRTLLVYYDAKDGNVAFSVPPRNWIQTTMIEMAGGIPVWQDFQLEQSWTKVNFEQIAAWNPDVILVTAYSTPIPEVISSLKNDQKWQALSAVQNGKFFGFAADVYSWDQPDTRWILGLKWVAKTLHPDLFSDLDIRKEAQDFYSDLYGMNESAFNRDILPLLDANLK